VSSALVRELKNDLRMRIEKASPLPSGELSFH
jgi:hypothetical protein